MSWSSLAGILALSVFLAAPTAAAERMTLTSQYGPDKPQTLIWERFVERLEAARPGAFEATIVIGGALGGEKEEAEAVRLGAITGTVSTAANLTTWVPAGAVLDLPFLFEDRAHIERALSGEAGAALRDAYRKEGFHAPAFVIFGARHLIGDTPFLTPDDLDGVTIRSLQSDLHIALWRALGANPTALAITEAYGALASGVVSAMDMTKSGFEALKLYEVAPVMSETAHIWAIGVVYFDNAFYESLSPQDRAALDGAARDAAAYFNDLTEAEQDAALARTSKAGARLVAVDQAPWHAALADFTVEFAGGLNDLTATRLIEAVDAARSEEGS